MTSFNLFEQLLRETESIVDLDQRHFPGGQHSQNLLAKCLEQLLKKDRINLFKRLTHLIAAAHRQNVDIGMLFFVCPATQSHLRGLFNDQAGGVTNSEPGGISVAYADGSTFEIQSNALVYLILAGNIVAELLGFTEFMACAQRIA